MRAYGQNGSAGWQSANGTSGNQEEGGSPVAASKCSNESAYQAGRGETM